MAEPIRNYTPQRDAREELRRKVEAAPTDHAEALLAAYGVLQEAQDHGVLDVLRGAIGAGGTIIGKVSEYANTPEGIRLMRNLLAAVRILGEVDPGVLDAAAKALTDSRQISKRDARPPTLWQTLKKLTGEGSLRTLATVAAFSDSFGRTANFEKAEAAAERDTRSLDRGTVIPVFASAVIVMIAIYMIGRHSSSD